MQIKWAFLTLLLICFNPIFSQEKKIRDIHFFGAEKTKKQTLKKIILSKKGALVDSVLLEKDIILLKRTPAVADASYKVINLKDNFCDVEITIQENVTLLPEINFWTTTNNVFSYKLGLYDYNFLGKNITFGGFYQFNGFDTYAFNFKVPQLFSRKWGLAVNHQNWKSEEPLYFGNESANYLYNNISFEVLGLHQINFKHNIEFGINFFTEKYQYLSGVTSVSIPQRLELDKTLVKLMHTYDDLNYFYQYVEGFKNRIITQYVATKNYYQNDFWIFWNDFFYYKRIGEKGNWANRFRFGLSSNENTPFAPFALDNNINLRGVGILVDRGTGSMVLNSEYRHTIYDKKWLAIQTNLFSDMGSWRNPGGEFSDFFKEKNIRIYSGIGLRFISKKIYNATFRIDYGFSILNTKNNSKGGFVFGIGQYF